ncbi:nuclear pore complex subunit Nro1-domain-containing protein [Absidia repens]|uniref:Nuclear pore complex subunit Nro1-domain-containing protein n=1 Tax=Absidia repens TaxID=90262 RepID=A0A1X2J2M8_9FUNG|nr:nuclear pore complex subunit Nro1-domain-containing protein [Absidia repens]
MAIEKKRPRGLKSSAASNKSSTKKAKTDVDENGIHENAQTVVIDKVVEEGDEVGEAAAIFEDAVAKLEKNPTEALALLRGTIHESDRILRAWTSDAPLPLLFYYTYGSALFELGRLAEDEEFEQFLEAAEERIQDGFDHYSQEKKQVVSKMNITMGKIWLTKAMILVDVDTKEIPDMAMKALDTIDKACRDSTIPTMSLLDLASIAQTHGDLYSILELRNKFTQWSEDIFQRIVKNDPDNARAISQLGLSRLSLANYWLDRMDEMEDEDDKQEDQTEPTTEERNALDAILEAKKYFIDAQTVLEKKGALTPQSYTDLAETYLNEANLTSAPEQQTTLYEQVIKCIDQAKSLAGDDSDYSLPEGLEIFLEEWNNSKQD